MGDAELMPFGRGAFASRDAIFGANAIAGVAQKLRAKLLKYAGTLLQCDSANLTVASVIILKRDGRGQPGAAIVMR